MPPLPLYLWTLWRYTNAVIIITRLDLCVHLGLVENGKKATAIHFFIWQESQV